MHPRELAAPWRMHTMTRCINHDGTLSARDCVTPASTIKLPSRTLSRRSSRIFHLGLSGVDELVDRLLIREKGCPSLLLRPPSNRWDASQYACFLNFSWVKVSSPHVRYLKTGRIRILTFSSTDDGAFLTVLIINLPFRHLFKKKQWGPTTS